MAAQQQHYISTAYLSGTTGPVAAGTVLCLDSGGLRYVIATSANRANHRAAGVAITAGDNTNLAVEIQAVGLIPASISGVGTGAQDENVSVSTTGFLQRGTGGPVVGIADADGTVYVNFGSASAFGGSAPFNAGTAPFPSNGQGFNWGVPADAGVVQLISARNDVTIGTNKNIVGVSTATGGATAIQLGFNTAGAGDIRTFLEGDSLFLQGSQSGVGILHGTYAGNNWAGTWVGYRMAIGGNADGTPTSQFAPFSTAGLSGGPFLQLYNCSTLPTGNPDSAFGNDKKAIRILLDLSVPSLKFWWPDGTITQVPKFNGTLPTTSISTNGVNNDILRSNGAGGFGTPLTPASGIANFLANPTSSNLAGSLTDETGTGSAVFATSPTLSSVAVTDFIGVGGATQPGTGQYRTNLGNASLGPILVGNQTGDANIINVGSAAKLTFADTSKWDVDYVGSSVRLWGNTALSLLAPGGGANAMSITSTNIANSFPVIGNSVAWGSVDGVFTKTLTAAQNYTLASSEYVNKHLHITTNGANTINLPAATNAQGYSKFVWNVSGGGTLTVSNGTQSAAASLASGNGAWFMIYASAVKQITAAFAVA